MNKKDKIEIIIINTLCRLLNITQDEINMDANFISLGITSKTSIELAKSISDELGTFIGVEVIYDYPSPDELANYLLDNLKLDSNSWQKASNINGNSKEISINSIQSTLIDILNKILDSNKNHDINNTFYSMGLSSLTIVNFIEKINDKFNLKLGVEALFDFPTIVELSEHIINDNMKTFDSSYEVNISKNAMYNMNSEDMYTKQGEKIAIIGMSGKFSGANNLDEYWDNLINARSSVDIADRKNWSEKSFYSVDGQEKNKSISKWAALISNIAKFDAEFFNISPREAERMDPQQRLLLEEVYKALEDSAYSKKRLQSQKVGVFVGARASDYINKDVFNEFGIESQMFLGSDMGIMAGRIAYFLNLDGPCLTIDTACSSGLVALHLACESIRRGESSMAIAGSVFLMPTSDFLVQTSKTGMLSPNGECKPFDNSADGIVVGEGVGAIILKPLSKAIEDGDNIQAVISGSVINQDGKTNGITAPSAKSQEKLILSALDNSNLSAESIGYIEAHGTGTKLGDPIEIKALTNAFRKGTDKKQFCYVGSHKANIGHCINISGLAGAFKVILSLKNKKIAPNINYKMPNEHINFEESPFLVNTELIDWKCNPNKKRIAGVSSFGFSGTNCHVVIEEWNGNMINEDIGKSCLIPISAKSKLSLQEKINELKNFLKKNTRIEIANVAKVLQDGRDHFQFRKAFIASNISNLIEELNESNFINAKNYPIDLLKQKEDYENGKDINGDELNINNNIKYASLPTYPFKGDDYWISCKPKLKEEPLAYVERANSDKPSVYIERVNSNEVFIKNHYIQGKNLMPGAAQIVSILNFLENNYKNKEINNLYLLKPIIPNDKLIDLKIEVQKDEFNYNLELSSGNGELKDLNSKCIILDKSSIDIRNNISNIDNNYYARKLYGKEFYEKLANNKDAVYGQTLQMVEEIQWDECNVFAKLNASNVQGTYDEKVKMISLLDGALQCLLVFDIDKNNMVLPFSFGKINIVRDFDKELKVKIQKCDKYSYNITILNYKNEVCAVLQDVIVKETKKGTELDLFSPIWEEIETPIISQSDSKNKNIIIIQSDDSLEISKKIKESHRYDNVQSIELNENTSKIVNLCVDIDKIYYIGKLQKEEISLIDNEKVKEEIYCLELLYRIVQTMDSKWKERKIDFVTITNNIYCTDVSKSLNPYKALIFGFIKSMRKEYYNWNIKLFDIDYQSLFYDLDDNSKKIIQYITSNDVKTGEYLINNSKMYKQKLLPAELNFDEKLPYKIGSVYVIIGGAGGIGLEYCKHLAKLVKAKLVIVGRRELDFKLQQRLSIINELGGEYIYYQLDISKENNLKLLLKDIKEKFGVINGVIHSALVLKDKDIRNMQETDLNDVLNPKVLGSFNLYNAFKDENLDFMIFFSSCQSFVGNPGQSNYAAATSFQDAFCSYVNSKSKFKVKVINWGYWGSVGVVSNERYNKLMQLQGYLSIEPSDGMRVIDAMIKSPLQQVVAIKAEKNVYDDMEVNRNQEIKINRKKVESIFHDIDWNRFDRDKNNESIEDFLEKLVNIEALAKSQVKKILDSNRFNHKFINSTKFKRLIDELSDITNNVYDLDYAMIEQLKRNYPELEGFIKLITTCIEHYEAIINEDEKATTIMFPNASSDLVEVIYQRNPMSDYFIEVVCKVANDSIAMWKLKNNNQKVRILEIGAGTGSTAEKVCKSISGYKNKSYVYTDISKMFLNYGSNKLSDLYDFVEFNLLDIEKDPINQGYEYGDFDIVIATNVLHATKNISSVLENIKSIMKSNGLLIINEMTKKQDYLTMTFGLLDGWWKYEDGVYRDTGSPILSKENWNYLLSKEGFENIRLIGMPVYNDDAWSQHVIVAENNDYLKIDKYINIPQRKNTYNEALYESKEVQGIFKSQNNTKDFVASKVCEIVSKCLGLENSQIDMQKPFADMGADSIVSVEIVLAINKELNIKLKNTVLFDYNNTAILIDYINEKYKDIFYQESVNESIESVVSLDEKLDDSIKEKEINERDIAIIGISGKFADYENIDEFWNGLCEGRNSIREIPKERWNTHKFYDSNVEKYDKTNSKWCGYLNGVEDFDPTFFNISGAEAMYTDPQQRIFLEECWRALEDSGYCGAKLNDHKCGVFAGIMEGDYLRRLQMLGIELEPQAFWGNDSSILASRISYLLDLHGPCVSINTACSSSLVALHLGCQSILTKECDIAIAGGSYVSSTPNYYILSSNAGMFSKTGQCKTFDQEADGFVLGEGAGVVVLKLLEKAIEDGDFIYGVVKGIKINQDGKTNGITAPSGLAQSSLELEVYKDAEINPETISYVEAHGTGTKLGDPIEFEALTNSFHEYTDKSYFCGIGSVKSNIGHLSAASGVASLIKVLMSFRHKMLPPTINFNNINDNIELENSPFYVNDKLRNWDIPGNEKRRAAISSFGFSGTNAHLVVEEYDEADYKYDKTKNLNALIVFSAKSKERLDKYIDEFVKFIEPINIKRERNKFLEMYTLKNIAYTLQTGRKEMKYRMAVIASSYEELIDKLKGYLISNNGNDVFIGLDEGYIKNNNIIQSDELRNNSLESLANMWVKGKRIEWGYLYNKNEVMNVPLPKSVFLKRKYWFDGELKGLNAKEEVDSTKAINKEILLYKDEWTKSIKSISNLNSLNNEVILILDNDDKKFNYIKKEIEKLDYEKKIHLLLGINGETLLKYNNEKYEFNTSTINNLISLLKDQGVVPTKIINLTNITTFNEKTQDYSIFYLNLIQSVNNVYKNNQIEMLHLFMNNNDYDTTAQKALSGLSRTLKIENSKKSLKTIMIDSMSKSEFVEEILANIILEELQTEDGIEVRYIEGNRFVKNLKLLAEEEITNTSILKERGVYLLTGGMGGIGKNIARKLAKEYKANIVICGRSFFNEKVNSFIEELESYGAKARYFTIDISQYENTKIVIENIMNEFRRINGVIHCAGTITKNLISKKTNIEFYNTLKAKVDGTINLDKALKNKNIDFFALFSSISSELETIYVGDYAYANSFMNYFAEQRENERMLGKVSGKTISMCWPLWAESGMQIDIDGQNYMYEKYGLKPLPFEDGWQIFKTNLDNTEYKILIINGDKDKFYKNLNLENNKTKNQDILSNATNTLDNKAVIEENLKKICSNLFNIPIEDIDVNDDFEALGINSIFMMKLLSKIESGFNTTVEPDAIMSYPSIKKLSDYLAELDVKIVATIKRDEVSNNKLKLDNSKLNYRNYIETNNFNNKSKNKKDKNSKIAVIGMSCRLPGANSIEEYWDNLIQGKEVFSVVDSRWDNISYFNSVNEKAEKQAKLRWGGFLKDIDSFDSDYFNVKSEDAVLMDPQQRIILELSQELFDNAGYSKDEIRNEKINVLIGATDSNYIKLNKEHISLDKYGRILVNMIPNMIAARISDYYNLKGESAVIDSACSSSLVAVHKACDDIRSGKCNMAVAGGVKLLIDPFEIAGFKETGILSEDGKVRVFDEAASGTILGEGAGLVLLKDYETALKDGDQIWAVISGSAANNDGKTMGLTVPSKEGQKDVILQAIQQNSIDVNNIRYFEAHGTGTLLGDPIEIKAASEAYKSFTNKIGYCAVGSVKSNMGHLLQASGIAGFIKIILSLYNKKIVQTLNCENPHPRFKFEETPFYPAQSIEQIPNRDENTYACISSFGFGGTNCHVIIEDFDGGKMLNYTIKRMPLPKRVWKKNKYWFGKIYSHTQTKNDYINILEEVANGQLSLEIAEKLIKEAKNNRRF